MESPKEIEKALADQTHSDTSDYSRMYKSGEKRYQYELEFNDYKTFSLLRQQVDTVQAVSSIGLTIDYIKPVVRTTESSIEARIKAVVKETENRYELENTQLSEFEEDSDK